MSHGISRRAAAVATSAHRARLIALLACGIVLLACEAARANPYPATGDPGVHIICAQTPSYACAGGGYNASTMQTGAAGGWAWRFYGPGYATSNAYGLHNCTLYAAYRLELNGVTLGWSANATDWGRMTLKNNPGVPVNGSPAAGAIAVWHGRPGSEGHVAYVESTPGSAIVVSEDNAYINLTRQEQIDRTSPDWPDAFIHFHDLAPVTDDLTGDSKVDILDVSYMLSVWQTTYDPNVYPNSFWNVRKARSDLNHDRIINVFDLSNLLSHWTAPVNVARDLAGAHPAPARVPAPKLARRPRALTPLSVAVSTSPMAQRSRGLLSVSLAAGRHRCTLRARGPGVGASRPFQATGAGRDATFRFAVSGHARPGVWSATVTCTSSRGRTGQASVPLTVTGAGGAHGPLLAAVRGEITQRPPDRGRREGDATSCVSSATGYCAGGAAAYVSTRVSWARHLGRVATWWTAGRLLTGTAPRAGAVAWWAASHGVAHVAFVESVHGGSVTVAEEGVYGPGMIDRALIGTHGATAPSGYLYGPAHHVTPGSAHLSVWPASVPVAAGQQFTVDVIADTATSAADHATVNIGYPADRLAVLASGQPSSAEVEADHAWQTSSAQASGTVMLTAHTFPGVTGRHPVALVTFKALAGGTAHVDISGAVSGGNGALTVSDTGADVDAGDPLPTDALSSLAAGAPAPTPARDIRSVPRADPVTTVHVGDPVTVPVWANITGGYVNAVNAQINYPTSLFSAQAFTPNSTEWPTVINSSLGSGTARLEVADSLLGHTGEVLVGTLQLQAVAPGSGSVSVDPQSVLSDSTLSDQTLVTTANSSYQVLP